MSEEKVLTLNFRKKILKDASWKRKKALINEIKKKFKKYEEIKIDPKLNEYIWQKGKYKIRVKAIIEDKKVNVTLFE